MLSKRTTTMVCGLGLAAFTLVLLAGCKPPTATPTPTVVTDTPVPPPTPPTPTQTPTPGPTSTPTTPPTETASIITTQAITSPWRCGTVADISLVGEETGWAVVNCIASSPPRVFNKGLIYRLDDGVWQRVDAAPILGDYYSCYRAVSAVGPEEMWAVGLTGGVYTCNWGNWLLHYLDGNWALVELDESLFTWHWTGLRDIDMVDAENGWAVGYGLIFRYKEGQWSVDLDLPPKGNGYSPGYEYTFETISMASTTHGWAGGDNGLLFHYENGGWTRWESETFESAHIMDVHTLARDVAWAVGFRDDPPTPFAWRYTADRWQEVTLPIENGRLLSVRMVSPDEVWLGGELFYPNASVILHYIDGEWERFILSQGYSGIESVDVVSRNSAWAGGWGFYRYSPPGNWQQIELAPAGVWP